MDYLRAGADIIETSTYQASVPGFVKYLGLTEEQSIEHIKNAVSIAKRAISDYLTEVKEQAELCSRKILVAGSCGPYGAALHDGSEYTGTYADLVPNEILVKWHRPRIEALVSAGVDILALETIPCASEAEALVQLLQEYPNTKAWMSFSCRDDGRSLADGSSFEETARNCFEKALPGQIIAVGVNCISPKAVAPLIEQINKGRENKIPLIVYPNNGDKFSKTEGWKTDSEVNAIETYIHTYLDLGVKYIGGCCRCSDKVIERIRSEVIQWQKLKNKDG